MPLKRKVKTLKIRKFDQRIMEKYKKNHEHDVSVLETKMKESTRIFEEKNSNMKDLIDQYKHIFDQLKDKIECPVCMEIPRNGPVYVCTNGHFVCKKCKKESCPSCRVAMGSGKSLLAVAILENIEHKCKFVDCEEQFARDKLDDHEKICKHRTVSCPYDLCNEKLALSKLLDHLGDQTCSSNSVPIVIENISKCGRLNFGTSDSSQSELNWRPTTYVYQDIGFVVFPKKYDNFYYFSMVMFGSEDECSKYNIELVVYDRDSAASQDSEVSFKFRGKPCSIDEDEEKQKYLGLTVNNLGMERILRKSNNFSLSFSLS